jgi:hypothetical protein
MLLTRPSTHDRVTLRKPCRLALIGPSTTHRVFSQESRQVTQNGLQHRQFSYRVVEFLLRCMAISEIVLVCPAHEVHYLANLQVMPEKEYERRSQTLDLRMLSLRCFRG